MMVGQKDTKRLPPDFFLADPPPPFSAPLNPSQYRADAKYSKARAIVLDMGSSSLRAGYSSCPSPSMQIPPFVARMRDAETGLRTFLIGNEALISSARSTARQAYDSCIPNNPALIERLLDGTLASLGLADEDRINHRFVLTEAPCQPNSARALLMELLFEAYEAPGICFGIDALFSYFYNCPANGATPKECMSFARQDAAVLSCGYNSTHVLPIIGGRITPGQVKRVNVGGVTMTDQLTRRLQLLHPEHSSVLTPPRVELLKEKICYVSEEYTVELNRIRKDPDYFNEVTKTVKVPMGEGADKPSMSPEEQARLKQARIDNGKRLSEMMKEKRRAKTNGKDKESGTEREVEDSSYTPEEVKDLYDAMQKLYEVKRIEEIREIDEDKYYIAMCVGQFESSSKLNDEIDKRQLFVDEERVKLSAAKAQAAEAAWWKRVREDELLSMSDSELSASELKRKRHVRALRGAAEARLRAKRAKLAEKAEAERRAEEIRKMKEERPVEYLAKLRAKRDELAERLKRRDAAREAGSDRRSQAARERMRLLAQHAGNKPGFDEESRGSGKGRGRGRNGKGARGRARGRGRGRGRGKKRGEEDTFGMNDSDWDVYRSMKVGNDGTDSEDNSGEERAELKSVRDEISQMAPHDIDPTMTIPVGSALLYEENRYVDEFPVTVDRIRTPELIFQPTLAGVEQCGIVEALQMSAASRSSIVREVFLTGGVANTGGLKRRICAELRKAFPSDWGDEIVNGVKVAKDPILDAWRGAARFAEMGGEVFGNACISKAEYEEMGNGYLKEHAFGNVFYPTPILSAADLELKKKMQKQASKRGRPKSLVLG